MCYKANNKIEFDTFYTSSYRLHSIGRPIGLSFQHNNYFEHNRTAALKGLSRIIAYSYHDVYKDLALDIYEYMNKNDQCNLLKSLRIYPLIN